MAKLIDLTTFSDARGHLTVIEKVMPFDIKRIFYIYGVDSSIRGKHRHHKTIQAVICLVGSCTIVSDDGKSVSRFVLDNPRRCVVLNPEDWHFMCNFSEDAILMVLASEYYDPADYIFEPYRPVEKMQSVAIRQPELALSL